MHKVGFLFILLLAPLAAYAQVTSTAESIEEAALSFEMDTEVGLLTFDNSSGDGERYLSSVLAPVIKQGLFSGGLRLRWRWNQRGLRDEDYDENADYLAIIRFLQYSEKEAEGYYFRLGDIDQTDIGYGQFLNRYRNTLSLDTPNTGLILDHRSDSYRFEGLFSSLSSPQVYGLRFAHSPFEDDTTSAKRKLAFGVTLAGDVSEDARWVNEQGNELPFFMGEAPIGADSLGMGRAEKGSPLTLIGFDAGMPLHSSRFDKLHAYAELGNIIGFGSGLGIGLEAEKETNAIRWKGWMEQRILGKEYVSSYFNSRYEVDRIRNTTVTLADGSQIDAIQSKRNLLRDRDRLEFGSFTGMEIRFTKHYRLRWSLEHSWNRKESGWFEIDFRVTDPTLPFQFRFVFDRVEMNGLGDILNGPKENGLLRLELAYLFKKRLLLGFRYRQSFEHLENLGDIVGQKKRTRVEPALIIRI